MLLEKTGFTSVRTADITKVNISGCLLKSEHTGFSREGLKYPTSIFCQDKLIWRKFISKPKKKKNVYSCGLPPICIFLTSEGSVGQSLFLLIDVVRPLLDLSLHFGLDCLGPDENDQYFR
jgi:hypothetical protein